MATSDAMYAATRHLHAEIARLEREVAYWHREADFWSMRYHMIHDAVEKGLGVTLEDEPARSTVDSKPILHSSARAKDFANPILPTPARATPALMPNDAPPARVEEER